MEIFNSIVNNGENKNNIDTLVEVIEKCLNDVNVLDVYDTNDTNDTEVKVSKKSIDDVLRYKCRTNNIIYARDNNGTFMQIYAKRLLSDYIVLYLSTTNNKQQLFDNCFNIIKININTYDVEYVDAYDKFVKYCNTIIENVNLCELKSLDIIIEQFNEYVYFYSNLNVKIKEKSEKLFKNTLEKIKEISDNRKVNKIETNFKTVEIDEEKFKDDYLNNFILDNAFKYSVAFKYSYFLFTSCIDVDKIILNVKLIEEEINNDCFTFTKEVNLNHKKFKTTKEEKLAIINIKENEFSRYAYYRRTLESSNVEYKLNGDLIGRFVFRNTKTSNICSKLPDKLDINKMKFGIEVIK